jgi:hypothetical protein
VAQESIILRRRVKLNFTTLDNKLIRDNQLSWKALGILTYLLSLPPDFKLYLKMLGNLRPSGRDSTKTGLDELRKHGYLRIEKIRDEESGRFIGNIWEVTDSPNSFESESYSPETDFPNTVIPNLDFPNTENPTLINNISNKDLNIQNTTTTNLHYYRLLTEMEQAAIQKILEKVKPENQQELLDELEGAIKGKSIKTSPVQWFRAVVNGYTKGGFIPCAGIAVAKERELRKRQKQSKQPEPKQSSPEVREKYLEKLRNRNYAKK